MNVDDYINNWNLESPNLLSKTATSTIYKVVHIDSIYILKLLTTVGLEDEVNGSLALKHFDGIGAAKLLKHDKYAQLLEFVSGPNLKTLVEGGEDEKATEIMANTFLNLHSSKNENFKKDETIVGLKSRFRALFRSRDSQFPVFSKAQNVVENLLSHERNIAFLHGDLHHENVIHSPQRGWLAIDPKGIKGESTYDLANTLINPMPKTSFIHNQDTFLTRVEKLVELSGLDKKRLVGFAFGHACLSACWTMEDGAEPTHSIKMAKIIEPFVD